MGIAWVLILSYLEWLNANSGHSYRLPSEAEWEYAARAGSLTRYAFGEELTTGDARVGGKDDGPVEVSSYRPNAWGLYDMHGNLAEWVQDCWQSSYAAPTDGSAWVPECIVRVVRGGSWKSDAGAARSAARGTTTSKRRRAAASAFVWFDRSVNERRLRISSGGALRELLAIAT